MARDAVRLLIHDRPVDGVLGLLSRNENGLTFALGYALERSPKLKAQNVHPPEGRHREFPR